MNPALPPRGVLAAWAAASLLGFLLHGPSAGPGAATGLLGAWLLRQRGVAGLAAGFAAAVPPLLAATLAAAAPLAALGLLAAVRRTRHPGWFAAAAAGALIPGLPGVAVPALGGAALVALGPPAWAAAGLAVALAPLAAGHGAWAAAAAGAALGAGAAARVLAWHPANLTSGRRVAAAGLWTAPAPAALAFVWSAFRPTGQPVMVAIDLGLLAALTGALLALAHLGTARLFQASDESPALWLAWTWAGAGVAATAFLSNAHGALGAVAVLGILAVPAGLGLAWASRAARGP